jgi:ferredoxin--NADP+ reductase
VTVDETTPFNARVVARELHDEAVLVLRVALDGGRRLSFEPGQFVNLGLPPRRDTDLPGRDGLIKRPYSIASGSGDPELEFFLRLVPDGALTPSLFRLVPGDPLWVEERAVGRFTLSSLPESPAPRERDLVAVSTGTGLAPFLSMLRSFDGQDQWRRLVLIHGVRLVADLGYRGELEARAARGPDLVYLPLCSRAGAEWTGLRGRVGDVLRADVYRRLVGSELESAHCQVLLCGNPEMIVEVETDLLGRGFLRHRKREPGQLHVERYW